MSDEVLDYLKRWAQDATLADDLRAHRAERQSLLARIRVNQRLRRLIAEAEASEDADAYLREVERRGDGVGHLMSGGAVIRNLTNDEEPIPAEYLREVFDEQ